MVARHDDGDASGRGVLVYLSARDRLRTLRPVVRVVLEDVALDAVWRDGRLLASTSARLVAEHVGVDAGTAASALRALRQRGFVELEQHTGPDGRFGLAGYTVNLPAGIEVIGSPCTDRAHTVPPRTVNGAKASTPALGKRGRRAKPRATRVEQGTLDLELGNR